MNNESISNLKMENAKLHKELAFTRDLLESASSIVIRWDKDGIIRSMNDFGLRFFGYSAEELIGQHVMTIVPEVEKSTGRDMTKLVKDIANNPDQYKTVPNENITKDGRTVWVTWTNKGIFDEQRNVKEVLAIGNDITALKEEELKNFEYREKLRISEERYRALYENAPQPYQSLDENGIFLDVNPAWLKILGYESAEVIGKNYRDFLHPDWQPHFDKNFAEFKRRGTVVDVYFQLRHKLGHYLSISLKGCMGYHPDGSVRQTYCVFEDISLRKQAEQESLYHKGLLEKSQELGHIGSWELDIAENKLVWTDENYRIFGVPLGTPLNFENFIEQIHPEDRDSVNNAWQAALQGVPYDIEHRLLIGEKTKWVREKADIEFDAAGAALKATGFTQNITEYKLSELRRKELESQLMQKYKMEAVGILAGGMAHNFNNLLMVILGNLALALRQLGSGHETSGWLQHAEIAGQRASDLIRQILTYSRNQEVKREPINLTVILAETMQLLSNTLPSSVILQASNDHPQVIASANATQIQEVLINLCNNAVHAMDGQGKLTLALEQVEVSEERSLTVGRLKAGSYARLSISDTGHGMEPAILEKIFDPFFTTKTLNEGTGMGLSTVLGIVQQHEGLINVRSALGQGSTFEIYFPLVDVEPLVTDKAETGLFVGTEKVLFLDDEEMLATLGGRLLTEMGYEVTIETNSLKALEMIKEDPDRFDLVITDQTMPELTGKELAQELQKLRPELPIILCTGYSSKISEEDAGKYGITTFCLKPLDFLDFSKKIRNALDRGK